MIELQHSVSVSRLIDTPRAKVFDAFGSKSALLHWFTPSDDIAIEVLAFEFAPGGRFRFRFLMPDGTAPVVGGAYERIERPAEIVFSWVWEAPDHHADIPTRVCVRLIDRQSATEVEITHERLPDSAAQNRYSAGWNGMLDRLEGAIAAGSLDSIRN